MNIVWNWGTNTDINFNPATDILDFGWFAADQFTISEVNGTVVIAIPSNHQTYTLQHTTLSDLHLSNIVAKDASALGEWTSALNARVTPPPAPPAPPQPPVVPPESGATSWSAGSIYTAGMTVMENGVTYKANWWTQGTDPAHHNGGPGIGQPWTVVATTDASHELASVPTGLAAAATSSTATILTWNASSVPGDGVVTGYAIFENGHQIATTTGTVYSVANLAADTTYTFAVAALDAAGSSAESNPISVHTAPISPGVPGGGNFAHEFSPYIDMAMPQDANLSAIAAASGIHNFTLAFVLSSGGGIGWQGVGTINDDTLANGTTILSQVQAIQAAGGDVTISFGGAAGQEPALTATSAAMLQAEYQSVINRYHVHSLDFDIEGAAVQDQHSIALRDQALVGLKAANPDLAISFTLPVLPTGLTADGLNLLASAKHDGLKIDVVNIMAMDYGAGVDNGGQMGAQRHQRGNRHRKSARRARTDGQAWRHADDRRQRHQFRGVHACRRASAGQLRANRQQHRAAVDVVGGARQRQQRRRPLCLARQQRDRPAPLRLLHDLSSVRSHRVRRLCGRPRRDTLRLQP